MWTGFRAREVKARTGNVELRLRRAPTEKGPRAEAKKHIGAKLLGTLNCPL